MELIYITRPILVLCILFFCFILKYRKPPEGKAFRKIWKFRDKQYAFSYSLDEISSYGFGARYFEGDVLIKDTTEHWHRVGLGFGFYRKSDSWIK